MRHHAVLNPSQRN